MTSRTNTGQAESWHSNLFFIITAAMLLTACSDENYFIITNSGGNSSSDGNNYTTNIAFTGTNLKTLTLTRNGMTDLTATFTDLFQNYTPEITNLQTTTAALYTNTTNLQTENTNTNARIDTLNTTKLNTTDQRYNDTAAINAVSTFAQTKAATGSIDCGAGNFLRVLTINNGSWTTTCAADSTGSSVTNVATGNGLTGGPITSTGTISVNSPTCGASEYLRWTGTAFVCSTPAGGGGGTGFTPYNPVYYFQDYDFESVTAAYTNIWVPTAIGAGTTAVIAGEPTKPGLVTISSSATASSGYSYQLANAAAYRLTNGSGTKTIVAPITKTGNVTICRFGYQDSFTTTLPTDGLFWNVTQSASGSAVYNFMGVARNNNAQTNTSVFAYTTTTTQYFKLETYVLNTTLAQFTIVNSTNGEVLAGPLNVTTNIPTAVGRETSHANLCYVNGATTGVVLARLDYTSVYNNATTFIR